MSCPAAIMAVESQVEPWDKTGGASVPSFPYLGPRLFSKNEEAMSQQAGLAISAEEDVVSSTSHVVGKMP